MPKRPHALDYLSACLPVSRKSTGTRRFGDDPAIVCGMAIFEGQPLMVVSQKDAEGAETLPAISAVPKPEGYRKAECR